MKILECLNPYTVYVKARRHFMEVYSEAYQTSKIEHFANVVITAFSRELFLQEALS